MNKSNINTLINDIADKANVPSDRVNEIVLAMVDVINNGALGTGAAKMSALLKIKRKKYNINNLVKLTADKVGESEEVTRKVVASMVEVMSRTINEGGPNAIQGMFKLMTPNNDSEQKADDVAKIIKKIEKPL